MWAVLLGIYDHPAGLSDAAQAKDLGGIALDSKRMALEVAGDPGMAGGASVEKGAAPSQSLPDFIGLEPRILSITAVPDPAAILN